MIMLACPVEKIERDDCIREELCDFVVFLSYCRVKELELFGIALTDFVHHEEGVVKFLLIFLPVLIDPLLAEPLILILEI